MTDNVARLKQLLFDNEAEALADLSRKLDLLQEDRVEFNSRFDAVFKRAGTEDRFQKSVAGVLDSALRDAEVANHNQLADAVAPVVVGTIKTEIRNSREELAEALYPMTGRMVKAYIATAMKELAESLNRKLDSNPVMLRLRSLTTGRPISDLLIAESQRVEVEELFLIRRGTGELIARWPANDTGHNRDQVMSGILTAINDFASEALKDQGSSLRHIDLGDRRVFLRASPLYLLAAKCSGAASAAAEKIIDDSFFTAIEQIHALDDNTALSDGPENRSKLLSLLAGDLREDLGSVHDQAMARGEEKGGSPLTIIAWIIGIPLAIWLTWLVLSNYWNARVASVANQIVVSSSELVGYPTELSVSSFGRQVKVSGLAPSRYTKTSLVNRLRIALPGTAIDAGALGVVPSGDHVSEQILKLRDEVGKVRPDIAALRAGIAGVGDTIALSSVRSNLAEAQRNIQTVLAEIPQLQADTASGNERVLVARLAETARAADQQLKDALNLAAAATPQSEQLTEIATTVGLLQEVLRRRTGEMSSLLIDPNKVQLPATGQKIGDPTLADDAQALAAASDHLSTVTIAVAQLAALKKRLPKPPPPVKPFEPTPRDKLEAFARRNAVFFSTGTTYRDRSDVARVLDGLAEHIKNTDAVVRVVGYTDEKGTSDRNTPLSQSRAEKVTRSLVRRGVPQDRLVALGRKDHYDISTDIGTRSPNRRVEFEVGFDNEVVR